MNTSNEIKEFAIASGADKCGIANVDRFKEAPEGFRPTDIYANCESVVVFLKQMPTEIIMASNPVPYTRTASLLYTLLDGIGLKLSMFIEKNGNHAVPVPADNPYLYWDEENKYGRGILSMRHAAYNAGYALMFAHKRHWTE